MRLRAECRTARASVLGGTPEGDAAVISSAWVIFPLFSATNMEVPGLNVFRERATGSSVSTAFTVDVLVLASAGLVAATRASAPKVTRGMRATSADVERRVIGVLLVVSLVVVTWSTAGRTGGSVCNLHCNRAEGPG
jgi:hypothetical protein